MVGVSSRKYPVPGVTELEEGEAEEVVDGLEVVVDDELLVVESELEMEVVGLSELVGLSEVVGLVEVPGSDVGVVSVDVVWVVD
jgi:hypothetical protein